MMERIASLAEAFARARPGLDAAQARLAVAIYRRMAAEGAPVGVRDLAADTSMDERDVERALGTWPAVFRDGDGDVVGFWGLTAHEMPPHAFVVGERHLWTWCAWDPLFIAPLLGREASVRSTCRVTGRTISLTVTSDGVRDLDPPEAVISFLEPSDEWTDDVITNFCHYVLYFADEAAGRTWVADHPATFLMSIDDAFELGRLTNGAGLVQGVRS